MYTANEFGARLSIPSYRRRHGNNKVDEVFVVICERNGVKQDLIPIKRGKLELLIIEIGKIKFSRKEDDNELLISGCFEQEKRDRKTEENQSLNVGIFLFQKLVRVSVRMLIFIIH